MFKCNARSERCIRLAFAWLLLGVILAFMSCQVSGIAPLTEEEKETIKKEVKARIDLWMESAKEADTDKALSLHPPDGFGADNGRLWKSLAEIDKFKRPEIESLKSQKLQINFLSIRVLSRDIALQEQQGSFTITDKNDRTSDPITIVLTAVWQKQKGQWVIQQYHLSFLPKDHMALQRFFGTT